MDDPLIDNTTSLLAAEAAYFTRERGMSEEAVAELLAVSVPRLRHLLTKATRHPAGYHPDAWRGSC